MTAQVESGVREPLPTPSGRLSAISIALRTRSRPELVLLGLAAVVLLVGLALRISILNGPLGTLNADETVSGLMARALLDGNVSTFYWEQNYGGTIELIPFAGLIAVVDDQLAIVVLPLVESAVIGALLFVLARRRLGAIAAACTVAVAGVLSASSVWFSTRAMLFYQPTIIAGLGAIIVAEQLAEDEPAARGRAMRWAVLGLLLGIGWWTSTQIMFFAVPAIGWIVLKRAIGGWRGPAIGVAAAIVGAAPWLAQNVRTRGMSLRELPGGNGGYVDHLVSQVQAGWPMALGVRRPFDERWVVDGGAAVLGLSTFVVVAAIVWRFVRQPSIRSPLAAVLIVFPVVHALAPSSDYVGTGRYYVYLVPSIAYAVVAAATTARCAPVWIGVAMLGTAALTTSTLAAIRDVRPGLAPTAELATELRARGVLGVYSNYWTSYVLVWNDEAFIASPDIFDRRPDWSTAIRAQGDGDAAYVFDLSVDGRVEDLTARIREHVGVEEEFVVGDFLVVIPERNVPPELLPAATGAG